MSENKNSSQSLVDVAESFLSEVKRRLTKDSVISTYLVAFSVYHWKIFFHIFEFSTTADYKIRRIVEEVHHGEWGSVTGYGIPFFIAAFYIFLYPKISIFVEAYYKKILLDNAHTLDDLDHEGKKSERRINEIIQMKDDQLDRQKLEYDAVVKELREQIKLLQESSKDTEVRLKRRIDDLNTNSNQARELIDSMMQRYAEIVSMLRHGAGMNGKTIIKINSMVENLNLITKPITSPDDFAERNVSMINKFISYHNFKSERSPWDENSSGTISNNRVK